MSKVTFNGTQKLIVIDTGITDITVKTDLYSDWKEWVLLGDNAKYSVALSTVGGDPLSGGQFLGATFFLENGWKIRPYEGNHNLTVTGNLFTRDGSSPFVQTLGSYNVLVTMKVSNLIDTVATGGSSLTAAEIAQAVWQYSAANPTSGSYGEWIKTRLLTVAQFLGMK